MSDIPQYAGKPLNSVAESFRKTLESEGFGVTTSNRGRASNNPNKYLLCIEWRGVYVGYMRYELWRNGILCGHRFDAGTKLAQNNAPLGVSSESFCLEHGLDGASVDEYREPATGQLYLRFINEAAALHLLHSAARRVDERACPHSTRDLDQLSVDLSALDRSEDVPETLRSALRDARLGQGRFRADLERIFDYRCAVTGFRTRELLRASHVLPWSKATNEQRLDPNNGLLLSANVDALFDSLLLTFRPTGQAICSRALHVSDISKLEPLQGLSKTPSAAQSTYLRLHNALFEANEQKIVAMQRV